MGPVDRLRAGVAVEDAALGFAAATRFGASILMGTGLAVVVDRTGGSPLAVSSVLGAYFLGATLCSPVWGAVADVTGRRRAVLVAAGGLATLAVLPLTVAEGVWTLVGLRGLYAVFAVGFLPVALSVVSARGGDEGRGRAVGGFSAVRAVGFAGGQLSAGFLLGLVAPEGLYLVVAAFSLASTLAVVLVADPADPPDEQPTAREVLGAVRRRLLPAAGDRDHLRDHGLGWLYVALALRNMTVLGTNSLLPVYLTRTLGAPEVVMGVVLAVNPVAQVGFMYVAGRATDAVGRKPLLVAGTAGSAGFALLVGVAAVAPSAPLQVGLVAIGLVVLAASFSALTTGSVSFIGDVAPGDRESELMGLRSTARGVGGVLGPPVLGTLATLTSLSVGFLVGSALAATASVLVGLRVEESRPTQVEAPTGD